MVGKKNGTSCQRVEKQLNSNSLNKKTKLQVASE